MRLASGGVELAIISGDLLSGLDVGRLVDAIEEGFLRGKAVAEPRLITTVGGGTALVMSAHDDRFLALKYIGVYPGNAALGLPTASSIVLLADGSTGVPLAIIDGSLLTAYRTGATSAVVARRAAPEGPLSLGFLGAGLQARAHAAALLAALGGRAEDALVYDLDEGRARELARYIGKSLRARVASSPEEVMGSSNVIVAATTSRSPVVLGGSLGREDVLVISIGWLDERSKEVDEEVVRRSSLIVVDSEAALREAAELREALEKGAVDRGRIATLAELLREGRRRPPGLVLYKGVGTAVEDLLAAELAYYEMRDRAPRMML